MQNTEIQGLEGTGIPSTRCISYTVYLAHTNGKGEIEEEADTRIMVIDSAGTSAANFSIAQPPEPPLLEIISASATGSFQSLSASAKFFPGPTCEKATI